VNAIKSRWSLYASSDAFFIIVGAVIFRPSRNSWIWAPSFVSSAAMFDILSVSFTLA
jgi:hypothetical protein